MGRDFFVHKFNVWSSIFPPESKMVDHIAATQRSRLFSVYCTSRRHLYYHLYVSTEHFISWNRVKLCSHFLPIFRPGFCVYCTSKRNLQHPDPCIMYLWLEIQRPVSIKYVRTYVIWSICGYDFLYTHKSHWGAGWVINDTF